MPRQSRNSAKKVAAAEKARQAVALRVKGASYDEIATALGYANRGGAWKAVDRGLAETLEQTKEDADRLRQIELMRLDQWLRKLAPKIDAGDHKAVNAAIKISESRRKLLGLNAERPLLDADQSGSYQLVVARVSAANGGDD